MANRRFLADDGLNELSDHDGMWGPLLFLRPARHERFSVLRVLSLSALLGGFYGMLGNVLLALAHRPDGARPPLLAMPLVLSAAYFLCAELSVVPAWNRRAAQLTRRLEWSERGGRAPRLTSAEDRAPLPRAKDGSAPNP
jgi:hypothetical protein